MISKPPNETQIVIHCNAAECFGRYPNTCACGMMSLWSLDRQFSCRANHDTAHAVACPRDLSAEACPAEFPVLIVSDRGNLTFDISGSAS